MSTPPILSLLGEAARSDAMEQSFALLNTLKRPSIESDEAGDDVPRYDWVLVRRKGIELGFVDRAYFEAEAEYNWGDNENLMLNQLTFFNASARDDVQGWQDTLPYGLEFADTRLTVTSKLAAYEAKHRSGTRECWDVGQHRLVVSFFPGDKGIETVHLKMLIKPWDERGREQPQLGIEQWQSLFGESADSEIFSAAIAPLGVLERIEEDEDEREVSFLRECGIELYFEKRTLLKLDGKPKTPGRELVFAAIKFFRARDREARQWTGELPLGLDFDQSVDQIIAALRVSPARREESEMTGFALWHFPDFSLHVLYSAIDNNLLRISMMAPGYWQD